MPGWKMLKTLLQHMLRKCLPDAILDGPRLLVYGHNIPWSVKIQTYLQQAAGGMHGYRNLVLAPQDGSNFDHNQGKAVNYMKQMPMGIIPCIGHKSSRFLNNNEIVGLIIIPINPIRWSNWNRQLNCLKTTYVSLLLVKMLFNMKEYLIIIE